MPYIYLTRAQLQALQDVWNHSDRVDWNEYDACRLAIIRADPNAPDVHGEDRLMLADVER